MLKQAGAFCAPTRECVVFVPEFKDLCLRLCVIFLMKVRRKGLPPRVMLLALL